MAAILCIRRIEFERKQINRIFVKHPELSAKTSESEEDKHFISFMRLLKQNCLIMLE